MAREDPQMKLRLPEELKSKISMAAEENGRSMNAEIIARLEWYESGGKKFEKAINEHADAVMETLNATQKLSQARDAVIANQDILLKQREILIDHLKSQGKSICQIGMDMAKTIIAEADKLPFQEVNKAGHFLTALSSISSLYESAGYDDTILEWASRSEDPK